MIIAAPVSFEWLEPLGVAFRRFLEAVGAGVGSTVLTGRFDLRPDLVVL